MDDISKLYDILFNNYNVVVITGAGISTLSGIPDFRGEDGLYRKGDDTEYLLSLDCFLDEQDLFYEFYKKNFVFGDLKPSIVHNVLAKLESRGLISTIITQNIDELHFYYQLKNVIELHGNGSKFYCTKCSLEYDKDYYSKSNICKCGSVIRPDIVLYGERVNKEKFLSCIDSVKKADKLIVLGSTLSVDDIQYVVANFIVNKKDFRNEDFLIINLGETSYDRHAVRCDTDLGIVFKKVNEFCK